MSAQLAPLSLESLGHLNYLHRLLTQPTGQWEGFYRPQSEAMNFALRYQLAFASYAAASMSQRTPAYRTPYVEALRGAIEKMLHVAVWGYWRAASPESASSHTSAGHVAVLLSPHQRAAAGPPSDPVARDNLQYSGHLSAMLGLYEKVSGDDRYDRPFTLHDPESGTSYTYTHGEVAERIYRQMRENRFGGVCCEPGMAYVPCNNYAMASNTLHDALHGTRYSEANGEWLRTVRKKMVLRGKAVRGIFGASYVKDLGLATPVAFNFTDAWGLAFLLPFDRPLVRRLYKTFRGRVARENGGTYVGSSALSEKMEISDVPINTGFGMVLARGMGDEKLARAFRRYATTTFGAAWDEDRYFYQGAPRTLHSTALYALAEAVEPGGESFVRLFRAAQDRAQLEQPTLERVACSTGRVGVSRADYSPQERALSIVLRQVGDPAELKRGGPVETELSIVNVKFSPHVEVDGVAPPEEMIMLTAEGSMQLRVMVDPAEATSCVVRLA